MYENAEWGMTQKDRPVPLLEQEQGGAFGNCGPIVSITPYPPVTLLLLSFTGLIPNIHFI